MSSPRLSLQPWVSRCARDSCHLHGWAHGFDYCLDWPIRDKPPEICGAECGHNLAGFRAIFDNYPRWWTLRGLTAIFRMLAHTLFMSLVLIISRNNSVLLWICNDLTDDGHASKPVRPAVKVARIAGASRHSRLETEPSRPPVERNLALCPRLDR